MKNFFNLKNQKPHFYIQLSVGVVAIISAIIFLIIDINMISSAVSFSDKSYMSVIFMILGGVMSIVSAFLKIDFLGVIAPILFGCAVGQHLYLACFPYADVLTGVPFFVNNGTLAQSVSKIFTVFLVIFILCLLLSVVSAFFTDKKAIDEKKV
ncbi:MAG: hypothetical protein LKF89_03920 [Bacilli bacterium]|jgi:ABC-type multidrug transport system fused ATPase/permease subunit|nr:hypothetical protein [Bacilli bacterium]